MVGCWHTPSLPATIVSRGFASVGLLDSNEAWVTLFFSTRSVPTLMSLSTPIFVDGYFRMTLSSAPLLLSTPICCLSRSVPTLMSLSTSIFVDGYFRMTLSSAPMLLSTPICCLSRALRPSRSTQRSRPIHRPRIVSLILLNPLPLPPRRPGRHRLVPAVLHAAHVLLQSSHHNRLPMRLEYSSIHPRRHGERCHFASQPLDS
jgi:hypothetical protein